MHVWEMPGNGHACDGCGLPLARNQTRVCGIAARDLMSIQFHAGCFVVWESEIQVVPALSIHYTLTHVATGTSEEGEL